LKDLYDCEEHFDNELSKEENEARKELYMLCLQIVRTFDESDCNDGGYFDRLTESDDDDEDTDDDE
jgi:hypothetical protein